VAPSASEVEPAAEGPRGKSKAKRGATPSAAETVTRIVANMERWRWMPDDLGSFHVWNNVPEQMTTVFKDGKAIFSERIVVGKPDTATPNFSANMQFVIFQPEWGVPPGIKNNEIGPLLRRASAENNSWFGGSGRTPSTVLARHGLRVSVGGQVVNPDSINWSSVDINRFNFIQPSGPTNVLGVVKFRFPNKHDVYMHDTPQKHLFNASRRAFSHGCMRVRDPVRFAEVLLEHDKGWSSERVRSMVPRGGHITLSTPIPVHNVYFTAIADEDGKVRTLGDLYGADGRVASALEGRAVAVASRGQSPEAEQSGGGRVAQRVKGERKKTERRTTTASASNPFAGLFGN
jgi:murein L,D-transpeptidase YcbB/YkuD